MGYSFSTHARNQALRKKMHVFMLTNYQAWAWLRPGSGGTYIRYPLNLDDPAQRISYGYRKASSIGFDFNASGWEREYCFTLVRWMALQIGKRRRSFDKDISPTPLEKPVPYVSYDHDLWPVLLDTDPGDIPEHLTQWVFDQWGLHSGPHGFDYYGQVDTDPVPEEAAIIFQQEMAALGPCPKESSESWFRQLRHLKAKASRPNIEAALKVLRAEMQRLDTLWKDTV